MTFLYITGLWERKCGFNINPDVHLHIGLLWFLKWNLRGEIIYLNAIIQCFQTHLFLFAKL